MDKETIHKYFYQDYSPFYRAYLQGSLKPHGEKVQVLCPFHEDNNPSLSIDIKTGLFKCFGCNAKGDVFYFYALQNNLDVKNDFQKILAGIAKEFNIPPNGNGKRELVATYEYQDASGNLLYGVNRYNPKSFSQWRPDGKGGRIPNIRDIKPVLYHLPEVVRARQVFIVEGEKDVDSLRKLGFEATCNSGGAGHWKSEHSDYLTGKDCILIPDNDQPGRDHMNQVAASLIGKAKAIWLINLWGLPDKGDVSDWIEKYYPDDPDAANERLCIMIDGTEEYDVEAVSIETERKVDPLQFPDWIMTGVAGEFAKLYAQYLEAPVHFFYMAFLTCLGSILSKRLTLDSEIRPQPRLYTLLLGESADERKSTAISKTIDFFTECVDKFDISWGVGSAEGLQKRLDTALGNSGILLLCLDEMKSFISKCKIQASVLLPCVNTLFESNRYESRTKNANITLDNVYLSMLAASTIETYQRTWDASFTDIGFNNRLFLCPGHGERKFSVPVTIPNEEKIKIRTGLIHVLTFIGPNRILKLSDKARELYHAWYMGFNRSIHSKRINGYALKFMTLLTVNELKTEVDEEVINKVISLCNWQYMIRQQHDPIDADNKCAVMEEKIRRQLDKRPMSERELRQNTNTRKEGLWIFQAAMKNLSNAQQIVWRKEVKKYELCP